MNLNVQYRDSSVILEFCTFGPDNKPKNIQPVAEMPWNLADELYMAMKRCDLDTVFTGTGFRLVREMAEWVLIRNGAAILKIPLAHEVAFGKQLRAAARKAEEQEKALNQIAMDALAVRSGAPFSLTTDPRMREQAIADAQWDPVARKGMPMNAGRIEAAQSARRVGTPSLTQTPPERRLDS